MLLGSGTAVTVARPPLAVSPTRRKNDESKLENVPGAANSSTVAWLPRSKYTKSSAYRPGATKLTVPKKSDGACTRSSSMIVTNPAPVSILKREPSSLLTPNVYVPAVMMFNVAVAWIAKSLSSAPTTSFGKGWS